uniref:UBC core domain-containing protein n=1 Tax=Chaetoceros debilis TaxID=122233 RepID=A0A7S3PXU4_9STRA|mmetsp:Transcript_10695/g.15600  ORF Transcript_10695/g.15600 Transcript_10695/m.15600 type:complete len:493 (+) Transcript_10695:52-1530(+)
MAQSTAIRRLKKEYSNLLKEPPPGAHVRPLETNFLHAHFLLHAEVFYDTPYEGGVYHGVLKFPFNYPLKPPTVILRTPSGRFQPDHKICFSMSDFHPELWNPMWSIRSIVTGLVSFMNSDDITTGGVKASAAHRVQLAKESLIYCLDLERDALASELFKEELETMRKEREEANNIWPPKRKDPIKKELPKVDKPLARGRRIRNTTRLTTPAKNVEGAGAGTEAGTNVVESSPDPCIGKNAAKNKKKKEREKRKKLVKKFTSNLMAQVPTFMEAVEASLLENGLDIKEASSLYSHYSYVPDHICWRTETLDEYTKLVAALRGSDDWTMLVESDVGGRSIATFKIKVGISLRGGSDDGDRNDDTNDYCMIDVVEIPAPKEGSPYASGLEHVEYVISTKKGADNNGEEGDRSRSALLTCSPLNDRVHQDVLAGFMEHFPHFQWNTKAKSKKINPDVSTKIELPSSHAGGTTTGSVKFHLVPLSDVIEYEKNNRLV